MQLSFLLTWITFIELSKKSCGVLAKISGKAPWISVLGPRICCDRAISPGLTCRKHFEKLEEIVPAYKSVRLGQSSLN